MAVAPGKYTDQSSEQVTFCGQTAVAGVRGSPSTAALPLHIWGWVVGSMDTPRRQALIICNYSPLESQGKGPKPENARTQDCCHYKVLIFAKLSIGRMIVAC